MPLDTNGPVDGPFKKGHKLGEDFQYGFFHTDPFQSGIADINQLEYLGGQTRALKITYVFLSKGTALLADS